MADFSQMLNNPDMVKMMMGLQQQRQEPMQRAKAPANPLSNLADAYPKLKAQAEQLKMEEQRRKLKKMEFDQILKRAEQAYKMREQQQQMAQGQQQIMQARQSV
jgi:hypothetical protein